MSTQGQAAGVRREFPLPLAMCNSVETVGLREEKKAEQRRAILDAAVALFRKRGYEKTRVRDIVERLRISEATFFNYFPTKDALLQEFALDQLDFAISSIKNALEQDHRGVPDRIRGVMKEWARDWDSDREFYATVATRSRMLSGPQGELREKSLRLYDLYEALFAEGQRRGEIRTDQTPLHLAEMLEGIVTIISGNWLVGWWKNRTDTLEQRFMNAVNVFLDGCAPPQRPTAHAALTGRATKLKSTRVRRRGRRS
jgi:AcrR family transcriptional regulator